jgi:putative phage-type endonuclease
MLTLEQIAARQNGIGASDAVILFPEIPNSYCTPYQLWLEKTGKMEREQDLNDYQWWGHELEPVISKRYELETGEKLEYRAETVIHPRIPFMLCHPDRYVIGKRKLTEIKAVTFDPSKWGEAGTDQVPPEYVLQVQHQLACTGYDEIDLIAFFLNYRKSVIYRFKRDERLITDIENAVTNFWNNHVLADIAPDLVNMKDCKMRFTRTNGTFIEASDEIIDQLDMLKKVRKQKDQVAFIEENIMTQILKFIGANDGLKKDDKILATWKANKNGVRSFRLSEK